MKGKNMNIFENLENLNVSEKCFDEIIGIVEEIINEMLDSTVDSSTEKRAYNAAKAFVNWWENPTKENKNKMREADKKESKNLELSQKRDERHGVYNTGKAGRVPFKMIEKDPKKYLGDKRIVQLARQAMDKVEKEKNKKD